MKILTDLLKNVQTLQIIGDTNIAPENICFDSSTVTKGSLFVATRGTHTDGHNYINMSVEKGAAAIVCEEMPASLLPNVTYILVKDSSYALGFIASNFYDNPSSKLKLIGVTGTNGKTTTVTLLYRISRKLGYKSGLISTVRYMVDSKEVPATHTTPDALQLNKLMNDMALEGCEYCFMEVSSHAVVQHRIAGLRFAGGIFSNLTHDHLDFHKTFEEYLRAKQQFFDGLPKEAFALVNIDDRNGRIMAQNTKATVQTYALRSMADFKCKVIESHLDGMQIQLNGRDVWTRFIGEFNAYNLTAVYATCILLDHSKEEILKILSELTAVEGRFEYQKSETGITAIVDYAHTPDALVNVLKTISQIRKGNEQVITVVGAGGDRDRTKRPVMAKASVEMSDKVILTSDNPRSEEPAEIIAEMYAGIPVNEQKKVLCITDRREAIKTACMLAQKGDIILVAGKGHENYQDVKGIKHHFDDKEEISKAFNTLSNK